MKKQKAASKPVDKPRILVIHGPNLNLLGTREPEHYGQVTLADINLALARMADGVGVELEAFQSNHEGALIERIHAAREPFRHHSYFSDLAIGVISGLGHQGYLLALEYLLNKLNIE